MYLIMDHPLCELNKIMQEIPEFRNSICGDRAIITKAIFIKMRLHILLQKPVTMAVLL